MFCFFLLHASLISHNAMLKTTLFCFADVVFSEWSYLDAQVIERKIDGV